MHLTMLYVMFQKIVKGNKCWEKYPKMIKEELKHVYYNQVTWMSYKGKLDVTNWPQVPKYFRQYKPINCYKPVGNPKEVLKA